MKKRLVLIMLVFAFFSSASLAISTPNIPGISHSAPAHHDILGGSAIDFVKVFNGEISQYVNKLISQDSVVLQFSRMMFMFLAFIALFIEITSFVLNKGEVDWQRHVMVCVMIILTLSLSKGFAPIINGIWGAAESLGNGYIFVATGNTDPMFLSKWINRSLALIVVDNPSVITTDVSTIVIYLLWQVVGALLELVMAIVGIWSQWGLAISKLIAPLFIPFLIMEVTRSVFYAWVRFFIGFAFLDIIFKITGVIAGITMQAEFKTIGLQCGGAWICIPIKSSEASSGELMPMIGISILSAVLVLSSFGIANQLSSAIGTASGSAMRGVSKGASKLAAMAAL